MQLETSKKELDKCIVVTYVHQQIYVIQHWQW